MSEYERLVALCDEHLRPISHWAAGDGTTSLRGAPGFAPAFEPPLSAAEQLVLDDLVTMARFGVTLTLDEWQTIKDDAAGLKAYLGLASPTNAQTVAAVKGIIRVLGTIIRS